jgi:glycosyltransferase involved in cell wall biosynthesis
VDLRVSIENSLPLSLPVGSAAAIFCFGHCFDRHQSVKGLDLLVDGTSHRPAVSGMPRLDLFDWLHRGIKEDPEGRSYRSGFWAILPVPARQRPGTVELAAGVRLADGSSHTAPLASIEVAERRPPRSWETGPLRPGTVAICMATYEPDIALFRVQVESLRDQTDDRWVCLISDDGTARDRFQQMREVIGDDPRFELSQSPQRAGPYRNFERALEMAPADAELLAFSDQDDRWYPDKLERLREALGSAQLSYCDQRLIDPQGQVLRESLWDGRRNDYANMASLLVANTVTGAAMLFRREVKELALPFPWSPGTQYHDHWLALVALATGEIAYVDRPLYDYVQHSSAVSGDLIDGEPSGIGGGSRGLRSAYFGGYVPRQVQAQTLLLRCGARMPARKRRALERFIRGESSPADFLWLAARPLRRLVGRDETLGGEVALVRGILWRWLLPVAVGRAQLPRGRAFDASFPDPPQFEQPRLRRWRAGI